MPVRLHISDPSRVRTGTGEKNSEAFTGGKTRTYRENPTISQDPKE